MAERPPLGAVPARDERPQEPGPPGFAPPEPEAPPRRSTLGWFGETVVLVVLAWLLATVLRAFIIQPFYIPSPSMEPTLMPGDRVLVNKFIYRFTDPKPGDIVVIPAPAGEGLGPIDLIKRVIAVGGQTVSMRDGYTNVDGRRISEPYLAPVRDYTPYGPYQVPAGQLFLMGDNRTDSRDSRYIGPLPRSSVVGKAFIIYWPLRLQPGQKRLL